MTDRDDPCLELGRKIAPCNICKGRGDFCSKCMGAGHLLTDEALEAIRAFRSETEKPLHARIDRQRRNLDAWEKWHAQASEAFRTPRIAFRVPPRETP